MMNRFQKLKVTTLQPTSIHFSQKITKKLNVKSKAEHDSCRQFYQHFTPLFFVQNIGAKKISNPKRSFVIFDT